MCFHGRTLRIDSRPCKYGDLGGPLSASHQGCRCWRHAQLWQAPHGSARMAVVRGANVVRMRICAFLAHPRCRRIKPRARHASRAVRACLSFHPVVCIGATVARIRGQQVPLGGTAADRRIRVPSVSVTVGMRPIAADATLNGAGCLRARTGMQSSAHGQSRQ